MSWQALALNGPAAMQDPTGGISSRGYDMNWAARQKVKSKRNKEQKLYGMGRDRTDDLLIELFRETSVKRAPIYATIPDSACDWLTVPGCRLLPKSAVRSIWTILSLGLRSDADFSVLNSRPFSSGLSCQSLGKAYAASASH